MSLNQSAEVQCADWMMYCSTCGAESQSPNAYCKRCGEWLPDLKGGGSLKFGGDTPQQNLFTGIFMSALSTVAALISAIALYATYLGSGEAKWSVYLAAAVCVCIAGWQASSFLVSLKLRQRLKKAREESVSIGELGAVRSNPVLNTGNMTDFVSAPDTFQPPRSIAEPTTKKIELADKKTG